MTLALAAVMMTSAVVALPVTRRDARRG